MAEGLTEKAEAPGQGRFDVLLAVHLAVGDIRTLEIHPCGVILRFVVRVAFMIIVRQCLNHKTYRSHGSESGLFQKSAPGHFRHRIFLCHS